MMGSFHLSLTVILTLLLASHSAFATTGTKRWVGGATVVVAVADRKSTLVGSGSSQPACRFSCGRCWPCEPVQVPIQPGDLINLPLEYYSKAWKCRCGNRLFNP